MINKRGNDLLENINLGDKISEYCLRFNELEKLLKEIDDINKKECCKDILIKVYKIFVDILESVRNDVPYYRNDSKLIEKVNLIRDWLNDPE